MWGNTLCRLWLSILLIGLGAGRAWSDDALLPDLQRIVDRGKLVVAVVDWGMPPMITVAEDGQLGGFDIELAKEIAAELVVEPAFLKISGTQSDVVNAVAEGRADIGISHLLMNVSQGKRVYFTTPYLVQSSTLLINRKKGIDFNRFCPSRSDIHSLAATPDAIGILSKTTLASIVGEFEPSAKLRLFESFHKMMSAVAGADILASLQGEIAAKYFLSRNPAAAIQLKLCEVPGSREKVAMAVRPDAQGLLRWLNLYLEIRGTVVDVDQVIFRETTVY